MAAVLEGVPVESLDGASASCVDTPACSAYSCAKIVVMAESFFL
jgi:hypothetical protein